jgi:uncharacterized UPF0160 family protein
MTFNIDLKKFDELYNKQLLPKEQILRELNITEYFYKKIIKEFDLKRLKRTCEFERMKNANKDFITIIKKDDENEEKIKPIPKEKINTLKNIQKRQQKPNKKDDKKYNEVMQDAINILKTTRQTLKDKEIL